MKVTDPKFLNRCESLHRLAARAWGGRLLGRHVERRLAGGTEVTGYSDYTSGDDLRYVDWNRCARHDELLTRQYQGTEEQSTYVLLDVSRSMGVGDGEKFEAARRLAAALAYLALRNLDRVAAAQFSDRLTAELPPLRGRHHAARLMRFFGEASFDERPTNLRAAAEMLARRRQRGGLTIILSDLMDPAGVAPAVDILRRRDYELFFIQVLHPAEIDPDCRGGVRLVDAETGRSLRQEITEEDLANYRAVLDAFVQAVKASCFRYGFGMMQTRCDTPLVQCIERLLAYRRPGSGCRNRLGV